MSRDVTELFELVSGLLLLAVGMTVILSPMILAAWILFPLDRMARRKKVRFQFMLVDYFSLVLLIQIPLAVKTAFLADPILARRIENHWVVAGVFCCVSVLIWWTGVRTFGQAGIRDTQARAILGLLILPLSYFGPLFAVALIASLASQPRTWPVFILGVIVMAMVWAGSYTRQLTLVKVHSR